MFKFTITLSKDEKKLIKRMTMSKSVRCKLFNDECRVWNMDITGVARRSYMVGYMEQELHVLNMLNIRELAETSCYEPNRKKICT